MSVYITGDCHADWSRFEENVFYEQNSMTPEDFENDEVMLQKFHSDRRRYQRRIRVNHHTWWSQEMPNEDEMMRGLHNLDANGNRVDFIITHCAPQEIVSVMYRRNQKANPVTRYFNQVNHIVKFDRWFFGHYHDDRAILGNKYLLMYEQILRIV